MSDTEIRRFEALAIPNDALEKGGVEILRASIVDGELHLTLRRAFEQPEKWGETLAECVRRIARVYAAADNKFDEKDVAARIHASFGGAPKAAAKKAKQPKKKARGRKAARRGGKR
ncbi:MAG TPA: DUF5076 domain-containing protein [Xanthobacteraceae bacterium]|nr:DUF5076 domain-containing protein [Xanthobacteraceae bacterium]